MIGAGPAGLAVSACLRRSGVAHLVVDRGDSPGSSWRGHYDRLHLHTPKKHSGLPFTPWPREAPRYPSRDEVVRYLEGYAEEHHVAPRFGLEVRRVARSDRGFEVETSGGVLRPRAVVIASGYNGVANRPDFPGLDRFAGPVIHSSRYRNHRPYLGKRTLVVGCGNSGAEIALDLAEHGVTTSMVVRGPVHVVPRDLFGRPTQETALLLARLPRALRDAMAAAVLRIAVGDLSRWGIVRPQATPDQMIASEGRIPMLDIGTIAMVKAGRITVMPAVEEILPDRVRFRCGRSETFDA
ncbi:MAG TPA: NAD(P)/FAD-dependent oxidoreductase, partial [Vicinamibacterales bacterium]|nr:NAD(P)/FAD-dependent oxidoreductase [Vicinamibacterales bacterium]